MDIAYRSDKGIPAVNEDFCVSLPQEGVHIVCDGLGNGHGEVAAKSAVHCLLDEVKKESQSILALRATSDKGGRRKIEERINGAFQEASKKIYIQSGTDPKYHGMCTTVDLLLFLGSHAMIAHVGSGRIYLQRQGALHQITEDHTHLAYLKKRGKEIPPEQEGALARKLTRAVGFQETVKVDITEVELQPGDRFLMVTDGIWMPLGQNRIEQLADSKSAHEIIDTLHKAIELVGAKDNFTSVMVEAPEPQEIISKAEQKIEMLGKVPAFSFLSYQDLIKVINTGDLVKFRTDQVLFTEGEKGGEMMLILSGSVRIEKNGKNLRTQHKGDVVGEMSLIDSAPRSATVIASEPTNVLAFPRAALMNLFREEATLAVKFLWGVTMETNKRLRMASNKLVGRPEHEGVDSKSHGELPFHS